MQQRLIPRPNSISAEDWEGLSLEEQAAWWKANQSVAEPKPITVNRILQVRRFVSDFELTCYILENLTQTNVDEILKDCPKEILQNIREQTNSMPADEDDKRWNDRLFFRARAYAPWVTEAEIKKGEEEDDRRFRRGLRLFRTHAPRN